MQGRTFVLAFILLASCAFLAAPFAISVRAQTNGDIQQQIADHNKKIADLEAQITQYQKQLDALGNQHQTLATSIQSLDTQRKALTAKIASLQQQIASLTLEITQLGRQISIKQQSIDLNKQTIAQTLRSLAMTDSTSLVEQAFAASDMSSFWTAIDTDMTLTQALRDHTETLSADKEALANQQKQVSQTQAKLVSVTTDLGTQKKAVDVTVQQKSQLLAQTKNQESSYQQLIATKKAQEKAFETELNSLEGQLKSVGASSIPHTGAGILAWPYSSSFASHCQNIKSALGNPSCVTQYFGNTAFAASGAYNGSGHNGIDFGMPIGTPVEAALSGTVIGTGNTDLAHDSSGNQCYSFGKWVMVQHANGLSTLYAHLSSIGVSKGQAVSTGDVLGYSGMTGYATGPHLHFGVYASAGVQILTLNQFRGANTACANATMPVAPLNAYLNPISYL